MKRILSIVLSVCVLLSCAVIFAACDTKNSKDWPVEMNGVTIDKEPENIVVLNDVHADVISYIGYNIKMVGRSAECDQDFLHVVPIMGSAASPDVNAIANADTDLVIADSTLSADAKSSIESNGAKVVVMDIPTNNEELKDLYINLGTVLGGKETGKEKGEKSYDEFFEMLDNLNTSTSNIVQTVAYLYLDDTGKLCTFTKGTMPFDFFNYNGKSNVFVNQEKPEVDLQQLRIGSPNYIFYDSEEVLTELKAHNELKNVNALKNEHTCLIPKKSFERYGSSTEKAIYDMLSYIQESSKSSEDEATPDYSPKVTVPPATAAPKATDAPKATEAPKETAAEEAAANEDVQNYDEDYSYDYDDEEYLY